MAKKKHASKGASSSGKEEGSTADARLWNALKQGDSEELQDILFIESADEESGAPPRMYPRPEAKVLMNTCGNKKYLPLSYAIAQGFDENLVHLLLRAGADINGRDSTKEQDTALHVACWAEADILVQLLLRCGADPRLPDAHGRTPLHVLASSNAHGLMSYVLEAVESPMPRMPDLLYIHDHPPMLVRGLELLVMRDRSGRTVLMNALAEVGCGNERMANAILDFIEVHSMESIEAGGADDAIIAELVNGPSGKDGALHTLFNLRDSGNEALLEKVAQRLLRLGANPLAKNNLGQSSLHLTARNVRGRASLFLTLFGAVDGHQLIKSFEELDSAGMAFIHYAILERNVVAVEAALQALKAVDYVEETSLVVKRCLGEVRTAEGRSLAELMDPSCGGFDEDVAKTLMRAGALDAAVYERLQAAAATEEAEEEDEEEEDAVAAKGVPGRAPASRITGAGRVQQARKARAQRHKGREEHTEEEVATPTNPKKLHIFFVGIAVMILLSLYFQFVAE